MNFYIRNKELIFNNIMYLGSNLLIAELPSKEIGLFQRGGVSSIEELQRALRSHNFKVKSSEVKVYLGVRYFTLEEDNGRNESE